MYIGAIPKVVKEAIHNFCQEAMKKAVGARELELTRGMCQNLRSGWNAVAKFARAKPRALQRAIAGQLMEYTKVLKEKEKK